MQQQIIGFGGAGGPNDLMRLNAKAPRQTIARLGQRVISPSPEFGEDSMDWLGNDPLPPSTPCAPLRTWVRWRCGRNSAPRDNAKRPMDDEISPVVQKRGDDGPTSPNPGVNPTLFYKRATFVAHLPVGHRYTASHAWLCPSPELPETWQVGLTKFALRMLGEFWPNSLRSGARTVRRHRRNRR